MGFIYLQAFLFKHNYFLIPAIIMEVIYVAKFSC